MDVLSLIAEKRIAEAQQRGVFIDLPGKGKPLVLEDDRMIPGHLRMAYKILKNAKILPPELEYRREVHSAVEMLQQCTDEQTRYRQMQKLHFLMQKLEFRHCRPLHVSDHYYRQVVERISIHPQKQQQSSDEHEKLSLE